MQAPATVEQFLELTRKSSLVEEQRLEAFLEQIRAAAVPPATVGKMAGALVRAGLLTHFQAEQLLQGKHRGFVIGGRYRLLERLGSGGMGSVFLCEHVVMHRRMAIKMLPAAQAADRASLERFYREARAAAALDHPNIAHAYDTDHDGKLYFLVMEHVDGSSLQEIVKKHGPMDVLRAAHYIAQAAAGLQHAHEAGLVHRDIKPGNLLLDRTGTLKVLDMGLALFFNDESDHLTKEHDASNVLGTADYLSPEQAIDSHNVDIRADIYSLGATFYFLLTGKTLFDRGTFAQKMIWHHTREPEPVRTLRPEVPEELAAILHQMIAKAPADRYQIPAEVAEALTPWTQEPIPPPPEEEMPRLSPASLGAGQPDSKVGFSTLIASGPATPAPGRAPRSGSATRGPQPVSSRTVKVRAGGPVTSRALKPLPAGADGPATAVASKSPVSPLYQQHKWIVPTVCLAITGAVAVVVSWALFPVVQQPSVPSGLAETPISPPQVRPAPLKSAAPPQVRPAPLKSAAEVRCFEGHKQRVDSVVFTPKGDRILSGGCLDKTLRLWELSSGRVLWNVNAHDDTIHTVSVSSDGRHAVSCSKDRTVRLWEVETGRLIRRFEGHTDKIRSVAFSPDGRRILSGSDDGTVRLWDAESGSPIRILKGHNKWVTSVAFAPDGRRALSGGTDQTVRLWDVDSGQLIRPFEGHKGEVWGVAISSDGRRAISGCRDNTVRLWDVDSGKELRCCRGHSHGIRSVAISPDGSYALSGSYGSKDQDRSVRLWSLETGKELCRFEGHTAFVTSVAFSPDGRHALSSSDDGTIRLWLLPKLPADASVSTASR